MGLPQYQDNWHFHDSPCQVSDEKAIPVMPASQHSTTFTASPPVDVSL
jgi:hypothetical protein